MYYRWYNTIGHCDLPDGNDTIKSYLIIMFSRFFTFNRFDINVMISFYINRQCLSLVEHCAHNIILLILYWIADNLHYATLPLHCPLFPPPHRNRVGNTANAARAGYQSPEYYNNILKYDIGGTQ